MSRISFSQISKYSQCPRSYKYYYVDRLRERSVTAFLPFGSAIDEALNSILTEFKNKKEITCDYKTIFDEKWNTVKINKINYPLIDCTLVGYAKSDFILDILKEEDFRFISAKAKELEVEYTDLYEIKEQLEKEKNTHTISESRHKFLNIINWLSLRRKGHLMLDAYVQKIIPEIEYVVDVQKKVELTSDCGSTLVGYVDAIVKFKQDIEPCVLDNKTSSMFYTEEKIKFSQQLFIYAYALGLSRVAYAVMSKNIKLDKRSTCTVCGHESKSAHKTCNAVDENGKRCGGAWTLSVNPECMTQVLRDRVEENTKLVVIDNIAEINDAIKAKVFPKNLNTCTNLYGNPCPYLNFCWKNDKTNLEIFEE